MEILADLAKYMKELPKIRKWLFGANCNRVLFFFPFLF